MDLIRGQDWKTFLTSYEGRTPRCDYWLGLTVPYLGLLIASAILDVILRKILGFAFLQALVVLAFIYPSVVVGIKRCHDRGRSGWFLLLCFVPILGIWLIVELGFLRGTVGPNEYGPDPLA